MQNQIEDIITIISVEIIGIDTRIPNSFTYQPICNVEQNVDRIQTVTDVFPVRIHNHYWFGVSPRQIIIVITFGITNNSSGSKYIHWYPCSQHSFQQCPRFAVFNASETIHLSMFGKQVLFYLTKFHTIKNSKAVLSCGGQGLAGGVQFVAIVTNANLKLDGLTRLLEHACTVEHSTKRVLPSSLVLLKKNKKKGI